MGSTRSTDRKARGVFAMYDNCPHCHKPLKRIKVRLFNKESEVTCYGSCGCPESQMDLAQFSPSQQGWEPTDHRCPTCGDSMRLDMRSGYVSDCPTCGYSCVFNADLNTFNAVIRGNRDFSVVLQNAGIPLKYLQHGIDLQGHQNEVRDGRWLYVWGDNGSRKSTFAANLGKALVNMGLSVLFRNSKLLNEEIKKTFSGESIDIVERCYGVDVLIIDDLGKEQPTEYSLSMLYAIVEARYGAMRPTVITSNYPRDKLAERWDSIDESTAFAIVSRLCDGVVTVEMSDRDWRVA